MTATAKSESEAVKKKLREVEELRRKKSYESLMTAQKRVQEYERHRDLLRMRKNAVREHLVEKDERRKERFRRNWSMIMIKEKEKLEKFMRKEAEYKELLKQKEEHRKIRGELKNEVKRMKGEGIAENLERLKRVKVRSFFCCAKFYTQNKKKQ